jgi:hypothetical protein
MHVLKPTQLCAVGCDEARLSTVDDLLGSQQLISYIQLQLYSFYASRNILLVHKLKERKNRP